MITFERKGFIVPQITYADFHRMAESNLHLSEKYKRYHIQNSVDNRNRNKILLSDKNVIFFPRKINGKSFFLHRIKPDIHLVSVNEISDLTKDFWKNYMMHFHEHILLTI